MSLQKNAEWRHDFIANTSILTESNISAKISLDKLHRSSMFHLVFFIYFFIKKTPVRRDGCSFEHFVSWRWTDYERSNSDAMTKNHTRMMNCIHLPLWSFITCLIYLFLFVILCCGSARALWCAISGWISQEPLKNRQRDGETERQALSIQSQPCDKKHASLHLCFIFSFARVYQIFRAQTRPKIWSTTKISLSHDQFIFHKQDPSLHCIQSTNIF